MVTRSVTLNGIYIRNIGPAKAGTHYESIPARDPKQEGPSYSQATAKPKPGHSEATARPKPGHSEATARPNRRPQRPQRYHRFGGGSRFLVLYQYRRQDP